MGQYPTKARIRIWLGFFSTIFAGIVLSKLMESWIAGLLIAVPVGLALTSQWAKKAMSKK
ncbi:hypothetical protein B6D60_03755 [candidate division KSB1 bacterium 4484_87]|nr:MAG: hypothetical protein B6D60_03755 [candidate division KSB1 bacterium 4484_87]